jgi:hypothetical protein
LQWCKSIPILSKLCRYSLPTHFFPYNL